MTWHSSFYAFLAFSLEKNPFMAVLCCIIISYPTHWHTIGWSSAVKLYCDWKSGVRRETHPSLVFLTVSFLSPMGPGMFALGCWVYIGPITQFPIEPRVHAPHSAQSAYEHFSEKQPKNSKHIHKTEWNFPEQWKSRLYSTLLCQSWVMLWLLWYHQCSCLMVTQPTEEVHCVYDH